MVVSPLADPSTPQQRVCQPMHSLTLQKSSQLVVALPAQLNVLLAMSMMFACGTTRVPLPQLHRTTTNELHPTSCTSPLMNQQEQLLPTTQTPLVPPSMGQVPAQQSPRHIQQQLTAPTRLPTFPVFYLAMTTKQVTQSPTRFPLMAPRELQLCRQALEPLVMLPMKAQRAVTPLHIKFQAPTAHLHPRTPSVHLHNQWPVRRRLDKQVTFQQP